MAARPRVLVVDNDTLSLSTTARCLRRSGYEIAVATCGAAALCTPGRFWCAVFDVDLADGSGIDFAEQLSRARRVDRIVFFSASPTTSERARAEHIGTFVDKLAGVAELTCAVADIPTVRSARRSCAACDIARQ